MVGRGLQARIVGSCQLPLPCWALRVFPASVVFRTIPAEHRWELLCCWTGLARVGDGTPGTVQSMGRPWLPILTTRRVRFLGCTYSSHITRKEAQGAIWSIVNLQPVFLAPHLRFES